MLVSCPGCGKRVSDRAPQCPFCERLLAPAAVPGAASIAPLAGPASMPAPAAPAASALPSPPPAVARPPVVAPAPVAPTLPGRYARGDAIGDAFRVRDVLGEGGFVSAIRKQAEGLQQAGVAPAPRSAFGFLHEGAFQGAAGRMREAAASFDQALAIDPSSRAAHLHKGLLLRRQKRYPEAVATLDQALAQALLLGVASPVLLAAQAQRARARLHELRGGPR